MYIIVRDGKYLSGTMNSYVWEDNREFAWVFKNLEPAIRFANRHFPGSYVESYEEPTSNVGPERLVRMFPMGG